jgi:hypothetical protein
MSIDENSNENQASNQGEVTKPAETSTPEVAAQPTPSPAADSAKNAASDLLATFLALKDSNPKVFFGSIGVVVLLIVFLFSGSDSNGKLPVHQAKPVVVGQSYVLKGANAYDQNTTIRLVAVPGSMAAYDDTEENDREGGCKHIQNGTPVKVVQSQDAYGKKDVFVEVEMLGGECEGKRGWALAINLQ